MNPEVFYLHIQGEQRGPYTVPQIDHLLNSGLIEEETLFWREGLEQWQPVTNLVALRKKARPWLKPAIAGGLLLILALFVRLFGPSVREGWREVAQHEFSANAAYWRSRDFVRHSSLPEGTLFDFEPASAGEVQLIPPDGAAVTLHGKLTDPHGQSRPATWDIVLHYDSRLKEWTAVSVYEISQPPWTSR